MLQGYPNQTYDERVSDWLSSVQESLRGKCRYRKRLLCQCRVHSYPQSNFLLQNNSNQYRIYPQIQILGDTREINGMLSLAGIEYNKSISPGNKASEDEIKSVYFPKMLDELSNKTKANLCQFLALDYYLFDFVPPIECHGLAIWTDYNAVICNIGAYTPATLYSHSQGEGLKC